MYVFKMTAADPTIPWPARGSAEKALCDRPGWDRRTIPVIDGGAPSIMEAMCCGELAVNLMLRDDEGFAICIAATGWRISYGGRVFARCADAMVAAEAMMEAAPNWALCQTRPFTDAQALTLKSIMEAAERRGEILLDQVWPT